MTSLPHLPIVALLLACVIAPLPAGAQSDPRPVTLQSLLQEMVDLDAVARLPAPAFSLKQASSHDRRKNDPGHPESWHTNNDHDQFLHTEINEGRREWVIMEETGPGAIVRFWTPLHAANDKQIIRFYFDGSPAPVITANFNELLAGTAFVRPPLAFVAWNESDLINQLKPGFKARRGVAGDLYLPIPYAAGCKITLDSVPFYYVINYRQYAPGTTVRTFTMEDFEAADPRDLPIVAPTGNNLGRQAVLAPGEELLLDLPAGSAAVRAVQVQVDPPALRSTILQATFDDEPAVWCPVGEFFGAGARLNPVKDWWRTVAADGMLTARWVMPYQRSARLSLKNAGGKPVTVKLAATTGKWEWDERSLHFHANWRGQAEIKTRPATDWNFLEVQGQGRYVGDTLTVFSPVAAWYGEGDERIYYDGATYPQHIGTGTEDYYGYAWGMAGFFSSPFLSMPQRDHTAQDDWRGYTTTSRLRLLDSIPFRTALKHDMEIWNWADTRVDYAVGTFWYARPGANHNREPQPREAAAPIRDNPGELKIAGAMECESLPVAAKPADLRVEVQDNGLQDGQWSAGKQLFVKAGKVGDFVELAIPVAGKQPRKVILHGTKSRDYGVLRFSINGQSAGTDFDAFHVRAIASGPIELGCFTPKDGKLVLRVEVVDANAAATGARYFFGLDCLVLEPINP